MLFKEKKIAADVALAPVLVLCAALKLLLLQPSSRTVS